MVIEGYGDPAETLLVLRTPTGFIVVAAFCLNLVHVAPACRLTVHRLAARTVIRSLEMQEREATCKQVEGLKKKVVELSVQSGVSSAFTAFIAVNKEDGKVLDGPLLRRNVPTASE